MYRYRFDMFTYRKVYTYAFKGMKTIMPCISNGLCIFHATSQTLHIIREKVDLACDMMHIVWGVYLYKCIYILHCVHRMCIRVDTWHIEVHILHYVDNWKHRNICIYTYTYVHRFAWLICTLCHCRITFCMQQKIDNVDLVPVTAISFRLQISPTSFLVEVPLPGSTADPVIAYLKDDWCLGTLDVDSSVEGIWVGWSVGCLAVGKAGWSENSRGPHRSMTHDFSCWLSFFHFWWEQHWFHEKTQLVDAFTEPAISFHQCAQPGG